MKLILTALLLLNLALLSDDKEYPSYMKKEVSKFKSIHFVEFGEFACATCNYNTTGDTIFIYHKKILVKKELQSCFDHKVEFNNMSKEIEAEYKKQLEEYWAIQKKQKE